MYCNNSAVLYSNSKTISFPYIYSTDKEFTESTTSGLVHKYERLILIPQDKTEIVLKSLDIQAGRDYFMFPGDDKKYYVSAVLRNLYGSPHMQHLEVHAA